MYFSDMYADRRLPEEFRQNPALLNEGMGSSLYFKDFRRMSGKIGFAEPRKLKATLIKVFDPKLSQLVGDTTLYSITYRLFKLNDMSELEDREENYD